MTSNTVVVLPVELELAIFETCIDISPESITTLLCVAKYIHDWLIPFVYNIIVVSIKNDVREPSPDAIKKHGSHIRHLLFGWKGGEGMLTEYMTWSPNIINLAIWCHLEDDGNWKSLVQRLPLVRLSIHPSTIYNRGHSDGLIKENLSNFLSSFPHLTHLDFASEIPGRYLKLFTVLPNLTFLSLFEDGDEGDEDYEYPDLRDYHPNIKCIIFLDEDSQAEHYAKDEKDRIWAHDPRSMGCFVPDYAEDWKKGARGEPDVWDFAIQIAGKATADLN